MVLYKAVLHHSGNTLPKWYLEALGCYVSHLNNCSYCLDHHFAGLQRLLNDNGKSNLFLEAVKNDTLDSFFDAKFASGATYAKKLTMNVQGIIEEDFSNLKKSGFSEGEILEINQVVSYFNYVNRSVIGLGANTCLLYTSPSPRDQRGSRMPSSA